MRFSHILISLPLLLCASQLTPHSLAVAAPLNAAEATELLAKSHAIDVKCSILASGQSQELKDFVARAEISLAEKASVSKARKTIAGGKAAGKAAVCDDAAKRLVNDVLIAATAAAAVPIEDATTAQAKAEADAPFTTPVIEEKPELKAIAAIEPEPAPAPLKKVKLAKAVTLNEPVKLPNAPKSANIAKPTKGLSNYASVAEKYYVATRCGGMSRNKINALYKSVISNHQQALANNRPQEVRAMLQTAETRAGAKSCG